jgi:CBS domain containing-hemolysin-like protein
MREDSSKLLSTILIGNNIVNISASALTTVLCTNLLGSRFIGLTTGILTFLVLIFGEITPKTIASQYSLELSLFFSKPVYILMNILTPVIWFLNIICRGVFALLRIDPDYNPDQMTETELLKIVDVSSEEGVIEKSEKKMINNVVDFGDAIAKDIMIPRADMICLDVNATYDELRDLIEEEGYSRLPVYDDSKDNIIGMILVKDILIQYDKVKNGEMTIKDLMREAVYVYEYQRTAEIFADMKASSVSMCIVLDEYGVTAGIITLEDLIEEIVGDIRDEYDEHENEFIKEISPGHYDVDGSVKLDDLNDALGTSLESEDYDSVGGLMIELLDRLPVEGDMVRTGEVTIKCGKVEKNRVERVDIVKVL